MKVNGVERGGTVRGYDDMKLDLLGIDTDGLAVGQQAEIEDGDTTYFGRAVTGIGGGNVYCDDMQKHLLEADRADIDFCLMMLEG